jgi:hypothetical protein
MLSPERYQLLLHLLGKAWELKSQHLHNMTLAMAQVHQQ